MRIDITAPVVVPIEPPPPPVSEPEPLPARAPEPSAVESLDDLSAYVVTEEEAEPPPQPKAEPEGRDRRQYVRTLADMVDAGVPTGLDHKTLGRIAIRRVAVNAEPAGASSTFPEATRAIRRATDRERIAELSMETIDRYAPTCEAAMLLVVRGEVAIGWKGFVRSAAPPPEFAVPLDRPGLVVVARKNITARCSANDLYGQIDRLLLEGTRSHRRRSRHRADRDREPGRLHDRDGDRARRAGHRGRGGRGGRRCGARAADERGLALDRRSVLFRIVPRGCGGGSTSIRRHDLVGGMSIERWQPREDLSRQEQALMKRLDRVRKLFGFLRVHRRQLFDDAFQDELATMYRDTGAGKSPVPPALMAMATLVRAYLRFPTPRWSS